MTTAELVGFRAVIRARAFNPSIIREPWLIEQKLLKRGDLAAGYIFSEEVVRLPTDRFTVVVVPQQLQFLPADGEHAAEGIRDFVNPLITALPQTPYTDVRIEYMWNIGIGSASMPEVTRRLFGFEQHPLAEQFLSVPDARFGTYLSKEVDDCRMRIEVKPIKLAVAGAAAEVVRSSYTFQRQVTGGAAHKDICRVLDRWKQYELQSRRMTEIIASRVVG
jgi:hypothetical protein